MTDEDCDDMEYFRELGKNANQVLVKPEWEIDVEQHRLNGEENEKYFWKLFHHVDECYTEYLKTKSVIERQVLDDALADFLVITGKTYR